MKGKKVGKTGFVEQRSFWNLFRSFDKLWIMLFLFLQAAIIVAWEGREYPWQSLKNTEVQVKSLTIFLTWSALRFLQSLLDMGMQYSLVSRETKSLGVRMVLKTVVAAGWILVFGVFYGRILEQKNCDRNWDIGGFPSAARIRLLFACANLVDLRVYEIRTPAQNSRTNTAERQWYEADICWKIENVICHEGAQRVERVEPRGKWVQRLRNAGFRGVGFSDDAMAEVKSMLDEEDDEHAAGWGLKKEEDDA